jgi:hypothetical protein
MFAAVTGSLQAVGLADRYPRHLELVAGGIASDFVVA